MRDEGWLGGDKYGGGREVGGGFAVSVLIQYLEEHGCPVGH